MRFLNVESFTLQDFKDEPLGGYAILSHRWTGDEISYQRVPAISTQLDNVPDRNPVTSNTEPEEVVGDGASIYKIAGACAEARKRRSKYIWIDSFCIDKTNPSATSETISSMFRYYQNAAVCFAFLFGLDSHGKSEEEIRSDFQNNTWFTRGWTLQELLASKTQAANIDANHLTNFRGASVAQKMSWLSKRKTKKIEDMAYCMLGLFDVNMALLYGEGEKAFQRPQEEIIKQSDDESIFAWKSDEILTSGLLAPGPERFKDSGNLIVRDDLPKDRPSYEMKNKGLLFPVPIFRRGKPMAVLQDLQKAMKAADMTCLKLTLNCWDERKLIHSNDGVICSHRFHQKFMRRILPRNDPIERKDGPAIMMELKKRKDGTWERVDCYKLLNTPEVQASTIDGLNGTHPIFITREVRRNPGQSDGAGHVTDKSQRVTWHVCREHFGLVVARYPRDLTQTLFVLAALPRYLDFPSSCTVLFGR